MAEVGRAAVRDPGELLPGGFWEAVAVWLEKPQVANKRLCGVRLEARRRAALPRVSPRGRRPNAGPEQEEPGAAGRGPRPPEGGPGRGPEESRHRRQQGEGPGEAAAAPLLVEGPGQPDKAGAGEGDFSAWDLDSLWDDFSRSLAGGSHELLAFLTGARAGSQPEAPSELDVVLRTVIPKTSPLCPLAAPRREVVVQDVLNGTVTFLPLEEDDKGNAKVETNNVYQLRLGWSKEEWFISVSIFCPERWHSDGTVYPKPAWLGEELLARLARWSVGSKRSGFKSTLSLVSIIEYSKTYQALKEKHKDMVKVWPEVTDPEKFVYEDVAIAAYLLVLWEEERAELGLTAKQSFVDLGCGNGLLVHILSTEGHPGRGIDVRRRKIWDVYGPQTCLEEGAITPSDETLFPDVDWVIGNHSDELTPWIPVIAARSNYSCRFFVLPCCFFDFVGKYARRQSRKTQYREYLDFVTEVGLACGFHVQEDCLRIPSTKRVCLIGKRRTYPPTGEALMDEQRTREKAERVRNCAALPRDFVDRVVLQVGHLLLDAERPCAGSAPSGSLKAWNRGGSLSLADVASELDGETLRRLKRECGGLQTLLKNNHQVFEVRSGRVHLRDWREERLRKQRQPEAKRRLFSEAFKTRLCWFFSHHPDGCALPSDCCPFAHGPEELRPAQTPGRKQVL
ncbi:probable tRNA (uracil-O(2)-)-methyltransferase isoform X2 [Prionailurus bengalensis]|uniref:probable tRNA (uracil-O(2)-)-methyltransferase isoform X2 n=1 Tax=Prionailurus bengalensis TaxID=37029 RepID=UPI001CA9C211|nr:probable tRNA (uracil-O(2)-)-methyltransferase isoform X2 [Prionailurus bengalensis]